VIETILACAAACIGKIAGCTISAKLVARLTWKESLAVGVLKKY